MTVNCELAWGGLSEPRAGAVGLRADTGSSGGETRDLLDWRAADTEPGPAHKEQRT